MRTPRGGPRLQVGGRAASTWVPAAPLWKLQMCMHAQRRKLQRVCTQKGGSCRGYGCTEAMPTHPCTPAHAGAPACPAPSPAAPPVPLPRRLHQTTLPCLLPWPSPCAGAFTNLRSFVRLGQTIADSGGTVSWAGAGNTLDWGAFSGVLKDAVQMSTRWVDRGAQAATGVAGCCTVAQAAGCNRGSTSSAQVLPSCCMRLCLCNRGPPGLASHAPAAGLACTWLVAWGACRQPYYAAISSFAPWWCSPRPGTRPITVNSNLLQLPPLASPWPTSEPAAAASQLPLLPGVAATSAGCPRSCCGGCCRDCQCFHALAASCRLIRQLRILSSMPGTTPARFYLVEEIIVCTLPPPLQTRCALSMRTT